MKKIHHKVLKEHKENYLGVQKNLCIRFYPVHPVNVYGPLRESLFTTKGTKNTEKTILEFKKNLCIRFYPVYPVNI